MMQRVVTPAVPPVPVQAAVGGTRVGERGLLQLLLWLHGTGLGQRAPWRCTSQHAAQSRHWGCREAATVL